MDYRSDLVRRTSEAWGLAQESVQKAQKSQKKFHDRHAKDPHFKVGDRVFVFMPVEKSAQAYKFAKPFQGPYRVEKTCENSADIRMIEKPGDKPIRVAFNHLWHCPKELSGLPETEKLTPQSDNSLKPAVKL